MNPDIEILIIDDNQDVLDSMAMYLRVHGFSKIVCADGKQSALTKVKHDGARPDIVISDYLMKREGSGIDVIEALRETLGYKVPGILLTGNATESVHQMARLHQINMLHKPVQMDKLLSYLEHCEHTEKSI